MSNAVSALANPGNTCCLEVSPGSVGAVLPGSEAAAIAAGYTKTGEVVSTANDTAQDDQDFQEDASCN